MNENDNIVVNVIVAVVLIFALVAVDVVVFDVDHTLPTSYSKIFGQNIHKWKCYAFMKKE